MKKNTLQIILLLLLGAVFFSPGCGNENLTSKVDQNKYLQKIWIVDTSKNEEYICPYSFFITKIEGDEIEGRIQFGQIALPDLFIYREDSSKFLGTFSGNIENESARCKFETDGSIGFLNINFTDDKLESSIENDYQYQDISGKYYIFRPYNIYEDLNKIIAEKEQKIPVVLNSWGSVQIVTELVQDTPAAFITDFDGNILYSFWLSITGTEINEVVIEDINDDGLSDIKFLVKGIDSDIDDDFHIWFNYIQMGDGLFYIDNLRDESKD